MEPKQWKHCPYCGHEMVIDGSCENCAIMRDEETGYHFTRQDDDDLLDNLANWTDDQPEEDYDVPHYTETDHPLPFKDADEANWDEE